MKKSVLNNYFKVSILICSMLIINKSVLANKNKDTLNLKPVIDTIVSNVLKVEKTLDRDTTVLLIGEKKFIFTNKNGNVEIRMLNTNENFNKLKVEKSSRGDTTVMILGEKKFLFINNNGNVEIRMLKVNESNNDKKDTIINSNEITKEDSSKIYQQKEEDKKLNITDKNLDSEKSNEKVYKWKKSYKGNRWSGLEWGFNNFLDRNHSFSMDDSISYMDLNTNRSWNININLTEIGFPLSSHLSILTGIGLEYNNYFFDGKNNIYEDNGYIKNMDLTGYNLAKSKLTTLFIRTPLLIEYNFIKEKKSPFVQAGVVLGLKLDSHTKYVYTLNGDRKKVKDHDDFNINWLRYGIIAKTGYNNIALYITYYPTRFFEKNKGPELYPINIGLSFFVD